MTTASDPVSARLRISRILKLARFVAEARERVVNNGALEVTMSEAFTRSYRASWGQMDFNAHTEDFEPLPSSLRGAGDGL